MSSEDGKSIRFPLGLLRQLDQLADLDIYGSNRSEIVRRFVHEGLERLAKNGTIKEILRDRNLLAEARRANITQITKKADGA